MISTKTTNPKKKANNKCAKKQYSVECFGTDAEAKAYHLFHSGYPGKVVDDIVEYLKLTGKSTILEVGAGTGKFTELMAKNSHSQYFVNEPNPSMLAILMSKTKKTGVIPVEGTSSKMPEMKNASVDVIFVAHPVRRC